jgi:hypothetical protein
MRYQCEVCDSVNVTVKIEDYAADHVPAEISYKCNTCGEYAYFAYGHYEDNRYNFRLIEDQLDTFEGN